MGPSIIPDKNCIQGMNKFAGFELTRYFSLVIPPVLRYEIIAGLKSSKHDDEHNKELTERIAGKIGGGFDFRHSASARNISSCELLYGRKIPTRTVMRMMGDGKVTEVTMPDGKKGIVFGEMPEHTDMQRWGHGYFTPEDELKAETFRANSKAIDLAAFKKQFVIDREVCRTLDDIILGVDLLLSDPECTYSLIKYWSVTFATSASFRYVILQRAMQYEGKSLKEVAPYTAHCMRVILFCLFGIGAGLLSDRNTNLIDMEYLYYLPFGYGFASSDEFLVKVAPYFIEADQFFVKSLELQADLKKMAAPRIEAAKSGNAELLRTTLSADAEPDSVVRGIYQKLGITWRSPIERAEQSKRNLAAFKGSEKEKEVNEMIRAIREQEKRNSEAQRHTQ